MILYDTGYQIRIKIGEYDLPVVSENLVGLAIKEDMGDFFVSGRLRYLDIVGTLIRAYYPRTGTPVEIYIYDGEKETKFSYVLTEFNIIEDQDTKNNVVELNFVTSNYDTACSPRISKGFGRVTASAALQEVVKSAGFKSYEIDTTLGTETWIQPYLTNKEMISLIAKKAVNSTSKKNDNVYYVTREGKFYLKSLKKLASQNRKVLFSNDPQQKGILISKMALLDRTYLFRSFGAYGRSLWYLDESKEAYVRDDKGLDNSTISDTSHYLGFETPKAEKQETLVSDAALKRGVNIERMAAEIDHVVYSAAMLSKALVVPTMGCYKDSHIGDIAEFNLMVSKSEANEPLRGNWYIVSHELIFQPTYYSTNFTLYRFGLNDRVGKRI